MISALTSLVCSWRRRRRAPRRHREQLGLGDELDRSRVVGVGAFAACREALRQRRDGDREALVAGLELGQRRDARRIDAAVAQQLEQALAPAFALGDDEDAVRRRRDVALQALQRLGRAAVDAEVGQGGRPGLARRRSGRAATSSACAPQAVKNSSGSRNSASGGRIGRSRSCWKKR